MKKVILLGLNELNFDYIQYYCNQEKLPNFKKILNNSHLVETFSEDEYHLLEPWIQWVTITTGKFYKDHKVYRLGDIVQREDLSQLFEELEKEGYTVGAVSPFNVDNRLKKPSFFVPDPWTQTKASGSKLLIKLSQTISKLVNENVKSRIDINSVITLLRSFLAYVPIKNYFGYFRLLSSFFTKKGVKAVFLDKFLAEVFFMEWKQKMPDFSYLFLNTGAHFQHHYLFNSAAYKGNLKNPEWYCPENQDPLLFILKQYDKTLEELQKLDARVLICTGLHQEPHKTETYYWRLNEHKRFLAKIKIKGNWKVTPRMSRDFLIEFDNKEEATSAQKRLLNCFSEKEELPIFSIDNRGESLFVELIYSKNIKEDFIFHIGDQKFEGFKKDISFVAIKNGQHNGKGYFLDTGKGKGLETNVPLTEINSRIKAAVLQKG